jgi:hypothetical protein
MTFIWSRRCSHYRKGYHNQRTNDIVNRSYPWSIGGSGQQRDYKVLLGGSGFRWRANNNNVIFNRITAREFVGVWVGGIMIIVEHKVLALSCGHHPFQNNQSAQSTELLKKIHEGREKSVTGRYLQSSISTRSKYFYKYDQFRMLPLLFLSSSPCNVLCCLLLRQITVTKILRNSYIYFVMTMKKM